jgi:uncharacterized secreted repeat protein (TIGR03808 family)
MDRRAFLVSALGAAVAAPAAAATDPSGAVLRGTLDGAALGLDTVKAEDQSRALQQLLNTASDQDRAVALPAGTYMISNLRLPARARLSGVAGATKLVFAGGDSMITASGSELVSLTGLVIDGAGQTFADYVPGLVHLAECTGVAIEDCTVTNSAGTGLALDRSAGRITRTTIANAAGAGIRAIESTGLAITDNVVSDCANGGILVWRWTEGEDGTIVSGNRVERIAAKAGGTGENGNGINVFRAHGVIVANNRIVDCAFTSVRANSADNVQITGNSCLRSGEVAIYSEFGFSGALIANNVVDGAASGIGVTNFDSGGHIAVVSGNILRNITGKGPYPPGSKSPAFGVGIAVEADVAASGNVIDGAAHCGMQLGWGPYLRDVAATGNVIRNAPVGIAVSVVDGAGSAVISDNLISGADKGAVIGMQWDKTATGDLAQNGAERYPQLLVERNRIS